MRGRMSDAPSHAKPVGIGEVMEGGAVSEVVASNVPRFAKGDIVLGRTGWQTYALSDGSSLRRGRVKATACATAYGPVQASGSEVHPIENHPTSVPQPAARQDQSVQRSRSLRFPPSRAQIEGSRPNTAIAQLLPQPMDNQ